MKISRYKLKPDDLLPAVTPAKKSQCAAMFVSPAKQLVLLTEDEIIL